MDPIFLRVLVRELKEELQNSWVVGVNPPGDTSVFLRLAPELNKHKAGEEKGLYISWDAKYPCLYSCPAMEEVKQAARRPVGPSTGQTQINKVLKKHLLRARLTDIGMGERPAQVIIGFERTWPREESYRLVLNLVRGHAGLSLMTEKEQKLLAQEGGRPFVEAGLKPTPTYIFDIPSQEALAALLDLTPPAGSPDSLVGVPEQADKPRETRGYGELKEGDLAEKLRIRTSGLSRLWAKELCLKAEFSGYVVGQKEITPERLFRAIVELYYTLGGPAQPKVIEKPLPEGGKQLLALSSLPLIQFPLEWQRKFRSLSQAAQYYYENKAREESQGILGGEVLKILRKEYKRLERLRDALKSDQAKAERARGFKLYGELLNAQVKTDQAAMRGQESIALHNYYQPEGPPVEIPLDPTLTLRQNAQRYFRLYQKAQRGEKIIAGRLGKVEAQLNEVASLRERAEHVGEEGELRELQELLVKKGWMGKAGAGLKPAPTKPAPVSRTFHRFVSSQGYEILVGKNARENDRLTFTHARASDLWLHAEGYGGAHVVVPVRDAKTSIPDKTLEEAAQLAVYFSKARDKGKIEVIYTKAKEVKKPKKAKAGTVTVGRYRTIIVDTDKFNDKIMAGRT